MKRASIKDIARLANVSHSTVSRALHSSALVNRDTAERIRRIAVQSGYRPSAAARSLVTRKTYTIGVVVTSIADPFAAEVVRGIEDAANESGYSVFLANSDALPDREVKVVRGFEERRVDGIIVTSSRVGSDYVAALSETRVPIVLLNNQHPSEFVHSVLIANAEASRAATTHLIELRHRRIAYIGDRNGHQSNTERFSGYQQAMRAAGLESGCAALGDGCAEGGLQAMRDLLHLERPPTAVFCYNDMTALGAMRAIYERGLRVPGDISLVGFDDLFFAQYLEPPLTTVRQPMQQMGRAAVTTLLTLIGGAPSQHSVKVPGELVIRKSTAPLKEIH